MSEESKQKKGWLPSWLRLFESQPLESLEILEVTPSFSDENTRVSNNELEGDNEKTIEKGYSLSSRTSGSDAERELGTGQSDSSR